MSVTSTRVVQVGFSGDIEANIIQSALENAVSPAETNIVTLSSGSNTITAPVISGIIVTGLTNIPPAGNTAQMTLKGIASDVGIPLHLTDPTSISLSPTFQDLNVEAAASIIGLRLIWS